MTGCAASGPQTFSSPQQGFDAYTSALAKSPDAALRVLGPDGEPVVNSGDPVGDHNAEYNVAAMYQTMHTLARNDDGSVTALIGPHGWPMPIPIVENPTGRWQFDVAAGKDEILNRRIGRNELDAIQVMLAIADAEQDYVEARPMGHPTCYAGRFISSAGKKDGLYWPTTQPSDPQSPLGDLIGKAADEGYPTSAPVKSHRPAYHGYYYRFLKSQGPAAEGGAWDYSYNGHMIAGFAVLAYPATYGNSGVMSFIINQTGKLYQRDLGPDTADVAKEITSFDPEPGWTLVTPPATTQP